MLHLTEVKFLLGYWEVLFSVPKPRGMRQKQKCS